MESLSKKPYFCDISGGMIQTPCPHLDLRMREDTATCAKRFQVFARAIIQSGRIFKPFNHFHLAHLIGLEFHTIINWAGPFPFKRLCCGIFNIALANTLWRPRSYDALCGI